MEVCKVEPYDEKTGKGLVRHVLIRKGFTTKELMVCLVINGRKIPQVEKLVDRLQKIEGMTAIMANVNTEQTNVILGKEIQPIWGQDYIEDYIGNVKYRISPLSFYQVNPVQTEKLYGKALEYAGLTGKETVWDLYCGIGTISLFLAQKAKQVYGVEIVPPAIADAKDNARRNGIQNAEFYVGKAEEILPHKYETENVKADVIVVDPPRKGCDEALLETIVKMQPERVVYVSCDSATLARDLKYLTANGYVPDDGARRKCSKTCEGKPTNRNKGEITIRNFRIVQTEGSRQVTRDTKDYTIKGWVMDDERLKRGTKALHDPKLRAELLATKKASQPFAAFCSKCRELGYEIYDMDLITAGEEAYAAMRRSTNGGGENSPMLEGEDDLYELFFAGL